MVGVILSWILAYAWVALFLATGLGTELLLFIAGVTSLVAGSFVAAYMAGYKHAGHGFWTSCIAAQAFIVFAFIFFFGLLSTQEYIEFVLESIVFIILSAAIGSPFGLLGGFLASKVPKSKE